MRVLIDTNILISAALSSTGTPFKAFVKAVTYPNHGLVCEQNIDEMRRIFNRKFPKKNISFGTIPIIVINDTGDCSHSAGGA